MNGTVVPLKVLRALGSALVDVNGQNSQVKGHERKESGEETSTPQKKLETLKKKPPKTS